MHVSCNEKKTNADNELLNVLNNLRDNYSDQQEVILITVIDDMTPHFAIMNSVI